MSDEKPRYSTEVVAREADVWLGKHMRPSPVAGPEVVAAYWFAERLLEILIDPSRYHFTEGIPAHTKVRFSPELDSFEFLNNMIPRADMPSVISMLLHSLDAAEQALFECPIPSCLAATGFFEERGFRRCNKCGFPGQ